MALLAIQATKRRLAPVASHYITLNVEGLYHPSYSYGGTRLGVETQGVQKQAAENFKWGR